MYFCPMWKGEEEDIHLLLMIIKGPLQAQMAAGEHPLRAWLLAPWNQSEKEGNVLHLGITPGFLQEQYRISC